MPHSIAHRITLAAFLAAAISLAGCDEDKAIGGGGQPPSREPVPVTLTAVRTESVERIVEVVGSLHGDEEATLSAKVPGRIMRVLVDVGDRVDPGQPLVEIDPTDYQLAVDQRTMATREALAALGLSQPPPDDFDLLAIATVERAKFQAANAGARFERARQLFTQDPPLISEQDYADLETAFEVAKRDYDVAQLEAQSQLALVRTRQSELDAAQQRLADTIIRAPSYYSIATNPPATQATTSSLKPLAITQRRVSVGEYVSEGAPMMNVVADDPIKFRAAVPERFIASLATGQTAHIRVEGYPQAFNGTISRINPAIDPASRTFEIEAIVPNPQRLLRPGAFARGGVVHGEDPQVPFVPSGAIVSFAGTDRVFSVEDGKAREHLIRQGVRRDGHVAIINGLDAREVIVTGNERLANGDPVTVSHSDAPATTAPAE